MPQDPLYRRFIAIRPEPRDAKRVGRVRDTLLLRSRVDDDRLHITLGIVEESDDPTDWIVAPIKAALRDQELFSCAISLSKLVAEDGIAKLLPAGVLPELKALQAALFGRLSRHDIAFRRPENFRPHMTLGYDPRYAVAQTIAPIIWRAAEIVLIESWQRRHVHRTLARWPLLPPSQGAFDFNLAA